jgi:hypothetical protein
MAIYYQPSIILMLIPDREMLLTVFQLQHIRAGRASACLTPTVLSIMGFVTAALIAGIYGMNFKAMPELQWEYGYPLAVSAMVAIDSYLFYRLRKAKWL